MTRPAHKLALGLSFNLALSASGFGQVLTNGEGIGGSGTNRLDLFGEAPQACVMSPPVVTGVINATFQPGDGLSGTILVNQLVDPLTAAPIATTVNLAFPVICNGAHEVTVRTANGGLAHIPPVAAPGVGFRSLVVYQLTGAWAGQTVTGGTDQATPVDIRTNDGAAGQLSVVVNIPAGGDPLVAGPYSDSLVIELLPAN